MNETLQRIVALSEEMNQLTNIVKEENKVLQDIANEKLEEKLFKVFAQIEELRHCMAKVGMTNHDKAMLFTGIDGWRHVGNKSDNIYIQIYPDVVGFGVGCKGFGGNLHHELNVYVADLRADVLKNNDTLKNLVIHWNDNVYDHLQNELATLIANYMKSKSNSAIERNKALKEMVANI